MSNQLGEMGWKRFLDWPQPILGKSGRADLPAAAASTTDARGRAGLVHRGKPRRRAWAAHDCGANLPVPSALIKWIQFALEEILMRIAIVLGSVALLALGGCSLLDRSSSSENVRTAYAGTASMTDQQVTQLLHNQGYANVTGLHQNGDDWVGAATTRAGKRIDFDMDKSGVIHTK